ncbi:MAG TPA: xanthine dehydrogenase family protein subunit M [Pusillimonas sp.]|uniref:FAD binding domain-containing protein n=1 Tax=Pusillimonas sp. TaxID=3040095 RepID=UPI002B4B52BE|nr:xanthine dehydrogenase family protein subunit M [Pusillimonas sp.]HLU19057.1 xanthine dehydrogenase family protein subunit M [Pusillimonas sp.]
MKAPSFDYVRPHSVDEVLSLLNQHGDDARILAGGQTLMATLNMRLSEPGVLIDINEIETLRGIELRADCLWIGAMARHSQVEDSPLVAQHAPLLTQAAPHVAHRAIRNQGTFGGSLAFADPAAEWPACVVALDAVLHIAGPDGTRTVPASEFFLDLYTTQLTENDLLLGCEIPLANGRRQVFLELARRHGDYAIVGVAATAGVHGNVLDEPRVVFLGMDNTPVRALDVEQCIEGAIIDDALIQRARQLLDGAMQPSADLYNSARTKLHLAGVLLGRALRRLTEHEQTRQGESK